MAKDIEYIPGTHVKMSDELTVGDVMPGREADLEVITLGREAFTIRIGVKALRGHNIGGEDITGNRFYLYEEADRIWRVNDRKG